MISCDLRAQIDYMDRFLWPLAERSSDGATFRTLRANLLDLAAQLECWERATGPAFSQEAERLPGVSQKRAPLAPAACIAQGMSALPFGVIDLARVRHVKDLRSRASWLDGRDPQGAA